MAVSLYITHTLYMYLLTWIIADGTQKDGDLLLLQAYSLLSTTVMSELKSVDARG